MVVLEAVAAEMFRLVSNQVNHTPLDIKVDPYQINLTEAYDASAHVNGIEVNADIKSDVVNNWSAGCQVFSKTADFNEFMKSFVLNFVISDRFNFSSYN